MFFLSLHLHADSFHSLIPILSLSLYSLSELKEGSWQVTRVVRTDELGRADEMLKEQMKKLELSSPASETLICAW